jgi:aminoglycoside phosphotransferase (APT) family kinase protein
MGTEHWTSKISLNEATVAELLGGEFDELKDAKIAYFNEGWDSWIFRVNENYLFRFPKSADSSKRLKSEIRLLPEIEDELPIPIPAFEYVGEPSEKYPCHYAGYEMVEGTPGVELPDLKTDLGPIAKQLGRFLSKLHSLPRKTAEECGVPVDENLDALGDIRKDALAQLETVRDVLPPGLPEKVDAFLRQDIQRLGKHSGASRLIHNDFSNEHILLDDARKKVVGIIDWGDVELGDPAMDFAGLIQWQGPDFFDAVREHYSLKLDDEAKDRARYIACSEGLGDIHYGIKTKRKNFAVSGAKAVINALR